YYNLVKQEKLYDVYGVAVERSQDQLVRTEKMFELGSKARLDVFQAKVNLGNDKINQLTQQNIVSDAKRALNISLGRNPNEPLEVMTDEQVEMSSLELDELISISNENQPLLKKNEADIESRGIGVSLAQANYYPRISAYYEYGRRNSDIDKIYKDYFDKDYYSSVGINLSWNLFNG
ncbi:MAG: TolC family protein, partial [Gammaproteobacteria bacterium]|nr:TolC family protein [Gammaproteobacteria bacterium]